MNDEDFEQLLSSIREAGKMRRGERKPEKVTKIETPDVKGVRENMGLTQNQLATVLGVSPRTVQNWEQHRRCPKGPATTLLRVASRNPKAILEALQD